MTNPAPQDWCIQNGASSTCAEALRLRQLQTLGQAGFAPLPRS